MKTLWAVIAAFFAGALALFGLSRKQAKPAAPSEGEKKLETAKAEEAAVVAAAEETQAASVEQAQIDASVAVKQHPAEFLNDFIINDYKKAQ